MPRGPALLACAFVFLATLTLCFAFPLRARGADTLPGRLGGVTLACAGSDDLGLVDFVRRDAMRSGVPYWMTITHDGTHLVSTWGPVPGWIGSIAMRSLEPGAVVDHDDLMRLARRASATTLALSALLFCIALLRWVPPGAALLWTLGTVASIAGAGTLGQALWQQTAALPFLAAALASLAWADRTWPLLLTPACLALLVATRPPEIALVLPLAALWVLRARARASLPFVAGALALAGLSVLPILAWNLRSFGSLLPVGQLQRNPLSGPGGFVVALLGLLVSPGRGALWFAPILVAVLVLAVVRWARRRWTSRDLLAVAVFAELIFVASFTMWWGGWVSFGPRLLDFALWVGVAWLASARAELPILSRRVAYGAFAVSAAVGLAGGALFDPAKWHSQDPRSLWQVVDSPLPALLRRPDSTFVDVTAPGPFAYCIGRSALTSLPRGAK